MQIRRARKGTCGRTGGTSPRREGAPHARGRGRQARPYSVPPATSRTAPATETRSDRLVAACCDCGARAWRAFCLNPPFRQLRLDLQETHRHPLPSSWRCRSSASAGRRPASAAGSRRATSTRLRDPAFAYCAPRADVGALAGAAAAPCSSRPEPARGLALTASAASGHRPLDRRDVDRFVATLTRGPIRPPPPHLQSRSRGAWRRPRRIEDQPCRNVGSGVSRS
jgi:hypothetical protein